MIVAGDAKALEWVAGTFLSQDRVAYQEIWDKVDQHTLNQDAFGLPSRLIAKKFVFRLMYGGSAWSYAHDPDFTAVSNSVAFWQKVIDAFYAKYYGFRDWHIKIVQEAMQNGHLVMPTGRIYNFKLKRNYTGELEAPETIIKNYPVQGLGADLMSIARVSFAKRFYKEKINGVLVLTVHDSIVCDVVRGEEDRMNKIFQEVFRDIPANFERLFGVKFDLPMSVEVSIGNNMKELTPIAI
jgi:DNA polymerase-1